MSVVQWVAPLFIGALGGLVGVYYRESFTLARKVKLFISRLDVLLTEMEYDAFFAGLTPFVELGGVVQILSKRSEPGVRPIEERAKTYGKIREAFRSTDDLRQGLDKILSELQAKKAFEHTRAREKVADSLRSFERDTSFTKDEAFMALPFHVVFQWQRFSSILSRVYDSTSELYSLAEEGHFDGMRPALEDLLIRLVELMEVELTLSKNVRSYRERRILGLTLRFMFTGRVR